MQIKVSKNIRKIKFRCVKCGNCCKAFLYEKWRLELYGNEIEYLKKIGYRDFYYQRNGSFFMRTSSHGCYFLQGNRCQLILRHKWYPWNCSLFPLQLVKTAEAIEIRLNPAAEDICNGIGYGKYLNNRIKEIINQVKYFMTYGEPDIYGRRFYSRKDE